MTEYETSKFELKACIFMLLRQGEDNTEEDDLQTAEYLAQNLSPILYEEDES